MFKTLLITIFIVVAFSPTFAIIAVRDTTPVQVCDTLIDKDGVVSPAIIVSVGTDFIRFKQCAPNAKRIYTVDRSKIREIKAHTFVQAKHGFMHKIGGFRNKINVIFANLICYCKSQ